jgi:diketogulonate reductase-like aldo/keto reductase
MQTITLNNAVHMPALGLGVFQTPLEDTQEAVRTALERVRGSELGPVL